MSKNSENLLEFTCEAKLIKEAIEATSTKFIVLLPNSNFLVLTNSTMQDDITAFSILSKECFSGFKLANGKLTEKDDPETLPTFALEVPDLLTILGRLVDGKVKVSISEVGDSLYLFITDKSKKPNSKHDGRLILLDEITINETLKIHAQRRKGRFIKMLDNKSFAVPKTAVIDREYVITKLKDSSRFDPILPLSVDNLTQVAVWEDDGEYKVRVHSVTDTGNNFISEFEFSELANKLAEPLESSHLETRFKFPTNPILLEKVIKSHKSHITHMFIAELGPDSELPFLVMFCSKKDYGKESGVLYSNTTLSFVDPDEDDMDSEEDIEEEDVENEDE